MFTNSMSTNSMFTSRKWTKWNQHRWGRLQPNNIYWRLLDMKENSFKERKTRKMPRFYYRHVWKTTFLKKVFKNYWLQRDFV